MAGQTKKRVLDSEVTLQHFMMPEHANPLGSVHGGVIMKLVDEAAAICSMRHAQRPTVTVYIDSMSFRSPVHVGELVSLHARLHYVGRTSMEIGVEVLAENPIQGTVTHTNSAHVVLVALDDNGKPCEVPGLELTSDEEKQRWEAGKARQANRVAQAGR
jgi:acyl-CoA hydrolase